MKQRFNAAWVAHVGLVLTVLFWSGNIVIGRGFRDLLSPISLNYGRWSVALLLVLAVAIKPLWRNRTLIRAHLGKLSLLSLSGVVLFHLGSYQALQLNEAGNLLLLFTLTPVLLLLGSSLFLRLPILPRQWLGIGVALSGALVLVSHGDLKQLLQLQLHPADRWTLMAVLSWVIYSLVLRRLPKDFPPLVLYASTNLLAVLMMTPLFLATVQWQPALARQPEFWLVLGYVAVFASILAYLFWNHGVAQVGPGRAGMYLYLMPIFGSVLAWVFLAESLHNYQFLGGAFVLIGVLLVNLGKFHKSS